MRVTSFRVGEELFCPMSSKRFPVSNGLNVSKGKVVVDFIFQFICLCCQVLSVDGFVVQR